MIPIKDKDEIALMRRAGLITALAHEAVGEAIKEGVSTLQLDEIARSVILKHEATPSFLNYGGFMKNICTSVNDVLVHGIPSEYTLANGDIITVDIGACYKGYHGDCAITHPVGEISPEAKQLLEVTKGALYEGLKMVKPNNYLGDVSNAIQTYVEAYGYSLPIEFSGHGIGCELHEEPTIMNVDKPHSGPLLKAGMCLAIEPMVIVGRPQTKVLKDGWTVVSKDHTISAHFEHSVLITDDGCEILTTIPNKEE